MLFFGGAQKVHKIHTCLIKHPSPFSVIRIATLTFRQRGADAVAANPGHVEARTSGKPKHVHHGKNWPGVMGRRDPLRFPQRPQAFFLSPSNFVFPACTAAGPHGSMSPNAFCRPPGREAARHKLRDTERHSSPVHACPVRW